MRLSEIVRAEVERRFGPADAEEALRVLEAADLPFLGSEDRAAGVARVHLAILKLAAGSLAALAATAREASIDWRDVLVAAGLADENWREVLAESGFLVPGQGSSTD